MRDTLKKYVYAWETRCRAERNMASSETVIGRYIESHGPQVIVMDNERTYVVSLHPGTIRTLKVVSAEVA